MKKNKLKKIGFMQGRLVDQIKNNIQYFPHKNWLKEIEIAKKNDFQILEWTINYENIKKNPLYNGDIKKIKSLRNFKIKTVTCDFFMQKPFFKKKYSKKSLLYINDLIKVVKNCNRLNLNYIILPLVDNSSIKNIEEENELIKILKKKILPKLKNTKILFEIDYIPEKVLPFIKRFKSRKFGINYDTGNSAALNYSIDKEKVYFDYVKNIHIKDRMKFGVTTRLGSGNWKYKEFFNFIKKINYKGLFILQTARSKNKDHLKELIINRTFILNNL